MAIWAVISVVGSALAYAVPPELTSNPEQYWGRGFGCGQAAENYSVTIQVADVESAFSRLDAMLVAAGAGSQSGGRQVYASPGRGGGPRKHLQATYLLPLKSGEKLAKKIWDLGELTNYSVNRSGDEQTVKPIAERIGVLEAEVEALGSAGGNYPSAMLFLRSRLGQLKQQKAQCDVGRDKSSINVSLVAKP